MADRGITAVASAVRSGFLPNTSKNDALRTAHTHVKGREAFTLAELVVSVGVLVLIIFLAMQLLNSATTVTTLAHKRMDEDAQTRQLFDRMAIDFAQMVKRSDIDYYLKSSWFATGSPPTTSGVTGVRTLLQLGNDQIAFYCTVPGYYPTPSYQSPLSLVAYRINQNTTASNPAYLRLERMGRGLLWNAAPTPIMGTPTPTATPTPAPAVYMPVPLASPLPAAEMPVPAPNPIPTPACPEAGSSTSSWSSSEVIGPQVFRFEYYYLLKGQTNPAAPPPTPTPYNAIFSDTPWDTRICACPSATPIATPTPTGTPIASPTPERQCCHFAPEGMQDVAAVVVVIAVIDPKSRALLDNSAQVPPPNDNITLLGAQLIDWGSATCPGCGTLPCPTQQQWQTTPGLLQAQWQCSLNNIIANGGRIGNTSTILPIAALSGIRFYERYFYLKPPVLLTP